MGRGSTFLKHAAKARCLALVVDLAGGQTAAAAAVAEAGEEGVAGGAGDAAAVVAGGDEVAGAADNATTGAAAAAGGGGGRGGGGGTEAAPEVVENGGEMQAVGAIGEGGDLVPYTPEEQLEILLVSGRSSVGLNPNPDPKPNPSSHICWCNNSIPLVLCTQMPACKQCQEMCKVLNRVRV